MNVQQFGRTLQVGAIVFALCFGGQAMAGDDVSADAPKPESSVRSRIFITILPSPGLVIFNGLNDDFRFMNLFVISEVGTYTETGGDPSNWNATSTRQIQNQPVGVNWTGTQLGPFLTGTQTVQLPTPQPAPILGLGF